MVPSAPEAPHDIAARIFLEARTHKAWQHEGAVSEEEIRRLYELVRWGPTSNNSSPARFTFVTGTNARSRLMPAIDEGNHRKVEGAAVLTVVAYDIEHWRHWQRLSPHKDLERIFGDDTEASAAEAYRNSLIQAGYFILAARAVGLDVFPLTGFNRADVDASGLLPPHWRSVLLCCLGRGDPSRLRARADRLGFDEACQILE